MRSDLPAASSGKRTGLSVSSGERTGPEEEFFLGNRISGMEAASNRVLWERNR